VHDIDGKEKAEKEIYMHETHRFRKEEGKSQTQKERIAYQLPANP